MLPKESRLACLISSPTFIRERDRSIEHTPSKLSESPMIKKVSLALSFSYFYKNPSEIIKIIDAQSLFLFKSTVELISGESIIAIDTEHYKEPSNKLKTSTLQISTKEKIFIFDLLSIMQSEEWENYIKLLDMLFRSEEILKLVYEPIQDLKILNYTANFKYFSQMKRMIDLAEIKTLYCEKTCGSKIKGLRGLVENFFKRTLDKEEQTSDWLRRPLKEKQIHYAALDAFVLFKIYHKACSTYGSTFSKLSKVLELNFKYMCSRTEVVLYKFQPKDQGQIIIIEEN